MILRRGFLRPFAFISLAAIAVAATLLLVSGSNAAPTLSTDKADYYAAEIVTVTGAGFASNTNYDVPIIRPDGSIVKGNGTLSPGWDTVTSNGSGGFTYLYKLDGIFGSYEVRAYPSPWSGNLSEGALTTVTFTDADIHFSQCANDVGNDDIVNACMWQEGGINQNDSVFHEGDAVPHRLVHKLTDVGAYSFEFEYDFSKASIYAYDFLTSADQGPQSSLALLNPCADLPAFASGACSTVTNALYTGSATIPIVSDNFDAVPTAEAAVVSRNFRVACSGPGACSAIATLFLSGNGGEAGDVGENHVPDTDPDCVNTVAPRCGTASVKIRMSLTTPAGTSNSSPTTVYIWFGGHLASAAVWGGSGCGSSGTSSCGASSISGAPFHMQYKCLDEPDSPDGGCESVGNRDNQISPGTVQQGTITIIKDAIPNHAQDFSFTCTSPLGSFSLDDDADGALSNTASFPSVTPGTYTCTESAPPAGWSLTSLVCTDPDSGTTVNLGTRTATIDLDNLETVTCTFTNTGVGTINIVKDAVPNDAQDFSFTCTSPLGSFSLDDDADGTLLSTKTFASQAPGTYMCTESIPLIPWELTMISCTDPDSGTTTDVSLLTATIDLDVGETVTCTFTNVKQGNVTIIKDAVPNDAQNFSFTGTCFGAFSLDDDADGTLSNTKSGNVPVGSCTVVEGAPAAGWSLTSLVCSDPDSGTAVNLGTRTATIDVDAGESITCTFTNSGSGTIRINKFCDPAGDLQQFTFTRSYGANVLLSCGQSNITGGLAATTYAVGEIVPAGWDLTSATCDDGSLIGAISLQPGETVTCTFNNVKDAFIIICKETDPNGDPQSFDFSVSWDSGVDPDFSLTDGNCNNSGDLDPGTYSASESVPAGWVQTSAPCSDSSNIATIGLSAGETVTCTFNNTKTGSITIVKNALPDGTQGFFFTCSSPIGAFTLDDNGTNGDPFDNSKTTSGLLPGTYVCTESVPAGWQLTSATCSDGSLPSSIGLSAGENVTCTFIDTKEGSITIVKDVINPATSAQDFSFTCSSPIGSFLLDDDANGTLPNSNTTGALLPATLSCTENGPPAGWTLTNISCSDPDGGTTTLGATATIDLDAGEQITCTFTNQGSGNITIIKDTVPNGGQDFCFNGALPDVNGADPGDFCLDDDGNGTLANTHAAAVTAGTYAVNELGPTVGFQLTAITCVDPDGGTTTSLGTSTASIDLDPGESITCTFTNTQDGRIIIAKVCNPPSDPQQFTFTRSYGANVNIGCGASNNSDNLTPGTYSVAEITPSGWVLSTATCNDGSNPASIGLDPGELVTCTFTNVKNGSVVVNKTCVGGNDTFSYTGTGSGISPSFGITCVAGAGNQPFNNIAPSAKTVTEVGPPPPAGWQFTSLLCADPDNGSSPSGQTANIDLDPGETVSCTYTNTAQSRIIVNKVCDPAADPQVFDFDTDYNTGDIDLACGGSDDSGYLSPGTYSVSENLPAGWTLTSATCSDGSNPGSIGLDPGETVTCTFNNQKQGQIIVSKVCDPPADTQTFSFTPSYGAGFSLGCGSSNLSGFLTPGTHSVSETVPAGWTLTPAPTCSDGSSPASISLAAGETVTCTFNNVKDGTIVIIKDAVPNNAQDFSFGGTCFAAFSLDDDADGTLSNTKTSGHAPGTCTVIENAPAAGWSLTGLGCVDPSGGTTTSLGTRTASIALAPGETVTCTFTNTGVGNVVINKTCVGGNASFNFTGGGTGIPGAFSITCSGGSGSVSFNTIAAGSKSVSETAPPPPAGWGYTSLICADPDAGTTTAGPTASIDLDVNETVTCTYTNTKLATVIIVKDTVPNAAQDFSFACGTLGVFQLDDDADGTLPNSKQFDDVSPGSYQCTEANVSGYQITASCSDPDSGSTVSVPSVTVDADPGETVTCTFTNTFRPGDNPVGGIVGLVESPGGNDSPWMATWVLGLVGASLLALATAALSLRRRKFE